MKIYIPNFEPNRMGGGWTFSNNFSKGLGDNFTTNYEESTIFFIPGPTMVSHDDVDKAKRDGKKIALRIDNAVRHSRNRSTGMPRMEHFAQLADLLIYQSKWARDFLYPFTKKGGPVIVNGVDISIFKPPKVEDQPKNDTYLYVRSSRDEGKQWIMAWYWFVNNPGQLEIVGKFSAENVQYDFDFYNGEKFTFSGEQTDMAKVYQRNKHFLYTYLNDACSNTLLEAKATGCTIVDVYGMLKTGGAPDIMECKDISIERMVKEYQEALSNI